MTAAQPQSPYPRLWYSAPAVPPPVGVVVLVIWDGRAPFEAALVKDPRVVRGQRPRTCWLTHDKGRAVLLPCDTFPPDPKRPWAGWHTLRADGPDYWRPLHPDKWREPLPEPAWIETGEPVPVRLWSATQRPQALDAALPVRISGMTAAEMAREMEDMREAARAQGEGQDEAEPPEQQWWLDPHAVTYSQPGAVTMREAEGRLMRAFAAEWWVRVEWPRLKTAAQVLVNMARSLPLPPGEAAAADLLPVRPEPTGRDKDDMLVALAWLRALPRVTWQTVGNPLNRGEEVLRLRGGTPPLTWARIGREIGRSDTAARGLYRAALAEVALAANGGHVTPEVEAVRAERCQERSRLDGLRVRRRQ